MPSFLVFEVEVLVPRSRLGSFIVGMKPFFCHVERRSWAWAAVFVDRWGFAAIPLNKNLNYDCRSFLIRWFPIHLESRLELYRPSRSYFLFRPWTRQSILEPSFYENGKREPLFHPLELEFPIRPSDIPKCDCPQELFFLCLARTESSSI